MSYQLSMNKLILNNCSFISRLDKNLNGITLYCSINPNEYLSFMEQYTLLNKVKEYYLNIIIYPQVAEKDNIWGGLMLNNERLTFFWEEYVTEVEVQMEHIESTESQPPWDLSGVLSL